MDSEKIETTLRKRFDVVTQIKPGVAMCERRFNNKPVAFYYFDYSEGNVEETAGRLTEYQDALLAEHYYTHPGDIRWNYYLVFLLGDDNYKKIRASKTADQIEKDKVYTRKYVLQEQQLESFLEKPLKEIDSPSVPTGDISARWVDRLNSAGLAGIYGRSFRNEVMKRILDGNPIAPANPDEGIEESVSSVTGAALIEELKLKNYRSYPTKRDFTFGSMNLLVGPNGTGKTSLLEAIELCLCGNTFRSGGDPESDAIINIRFKGSNDFETYEPNNNKKYQQRNLIWYGRSISRGNDLHVGFNRYNFYNADSAYRLSRDTKPEEIDSAFAAIALGERANHIDRRLKEFDGDFDEKFKSLEQQLRKTEKDISEQKARIELHSKIEGNSKAIYVSLLREAEGLNLINKLPTDIEQLTPTFDSAIYDLASAFKEVSQQGSWVRPLSIEKILLERDSIDTIKAVLKTHQDKLAALRKRDTNSDASKLLLNARLKTLNQAKPYFECDQIDKLSGVAERERKARSSRDKYLRIQKHTSEIDLNILKSLDATQSLESLSKIAKKEEETIRLEIAEKNSEYADLEKTLSKSQTLLTQLNATAIQYLDLRPGSDKCPLCSADHSPADLEKIIREFKSPDADSMDSLTLKIDINNVQDKLLKTMSVSLNISRAMSISAILWDGEDGSSRLLSDFISGITEVPALLSQWEASLREIVGLQEQFKVAGISELGLNSISSQLKADFDGLEIKTENRGAFQKSFTEIQDALDTITKNEFARQSEIDKAIQDKNEAISSYLSGEDSRLEDPESVIEKRSAVIGHLVDRIKIIRSAMSLPDTLNLEEIALNINSVVTALREYRSARESEGRNDIEISDAKKKIEDSEGLLKTVRPQFERAQKALVEIREILKNDNKEKALAGFIEQNRTGINAIFSRIHSPREFEGLIPGSTQLKKFGVNDPVPLNKVSTGQRAALALSLFFALNASLRKAPPVILIDDPVAHIDDLNTLSFLDYLRDLVIDGDRQIFFATASQKLGNLIEKKFQFLGEQNFKKYEFTR